MSTARSTDVVARLGSDEFGVLLGPVRSVREAERVAARIDAAVAVPFDLDGQEVTVGASLGLAVGRASTTYAGDLLKEAEIALHRAKLDPVRKFVMFDPEMRAETLDRATLEHDLRRAIERSELRAPLPAAGRPRRPARSWASRRCSAGSTRPAASCRRCRSSRSPRRPA